MSDADADDASDHQCFDSCCVEAKRCDCPDCTAVEARRLTIDEAVKQMYTVVSVLELADFELPYEEPMRHRLRQAHDVLLGAIQKVQSLSE